MLPLSILSPSSLVPSPSKSLDPSHHQLCHGGSFIVATPRSVTPVTLSLHITHTCSPFDSYSFFASLISHTSSLCLSLISPSCFHQRDSITLHPLYLLSPPPLLPPRTHVHATSSRSSTSQPRRSLLFVFNIFSSPWRSTPFKRLCRRLPQKTASVFSAFVPGSLLNGILTTLRFQIGSSSHNLSVARRETIRVTVTPPADQSSP